MSSAQDAGIGMVITTITGVGITGVGITRAATAGMDLDMDIGIGDLAIAGLHGAMATLSASAADRE